MYDPFTEAEQAILTEEGFEPSGFPNQWMRVIRPSGEDVGDVFFVCKMGDTFYGSHRYPIGSDDHYEDTDLIALLDKV